MTAIEDERPPAEEESLPRHQFAAMYPSLRRFAAVVADSDVDPDDLVQEALAAYPGAFEEPMAQSGLRQVRLLYFDGCPHWRIADEHLRSLQSEFGFELQHRLVESAQEAEELGFRGSPSIVVDGNDLFSSDDPSVGLACRIYMTPSGPAGSPTVEQIASALRAPFHDGGPGGARKPDAR